MKVNKLRIKNYKRFRDVTILMNDGTNIFVGENDSGKTTILEALSLVLTGKIHGAPLQSRLTLDWFNNTIRSEYIDAIKNGRTAEPPMIEIEAYLCSSADESVSIKRFKGTNNSFHEDAEGVKLVIHFDDQYASTYAQLMDDQKIKDIPIEYYKVSFRSFANPDYYLNVTSKKVAYVDTTRKDFGSVLSRFVSTSLSEYLTEADLTELRHAYRANRHEFIENHAVKSLNSKLQTSHSFDGRTVEINLKESGVDDWKADMSISIDGIPLENIGFGSQNMFKAEIFLQQNIDVDILIIEEPENNLSYSNMSMLVSKLAENNGKQLFISTHSSYVANKLGLQCLHLVGNNSITPFSSLEKDTYEYFLKLPGYNTLRVILANKAILVEGPADELIIQRAYQDHYGKQPIENGIDVVTVDSLAFQRYCKLAQLINKSLVIVTDNDGNSKDVISRYASYGELVTLCVELNNELNTLEPSVLEVNSDDFESFRQIVYRGSDIKKRDKDSILEFMIKNKTEWSMRVFLSDEKIKYPTYILKAIGKA